MREHRASCIASAARLATHPLPVPWYLGYALDEAMSDYPSFTRIRQRLGIDVFQRFFEMT